MFSLYVDILASCPKLLYGMANDLVGLAARPAVFIGASGLLPSEFTSTIAHGGILVGLVTTVSVVLVVISVVTLFASHGAELLVMLRTISGFFLGADGLAQLPALFRPAAAPTAFSFLSSYPASNTGLSVALQLPLACMAIPGLCDVGWGLVGEPRYALFCGAVCCRYSSLTLLAGHSGGSIAVYGAGVTLAVMAVTPKSVWAGLQKGTRLAFRIVMTAAHTIARRCVVPAYRWLRAAVRAVLQHPMATLLRRYVLAPLWRFLTPLVLPTATAAVSW
jgi:hypothetical protein